MMMMVMVVMMIMVMMVVSDGDGGRTDDDRYDDADRQGGDVDNDDDYKYDDIEGGGVCSDDRHDDVIIWDVMLILCTQQASRPMLWREVARWYSCTTATPQRHDVRDQAMMSYLFILGVCVFF